MRSKKCIKCSGFMIFQKDLDGTFWECYNCGRNENVEFNSSVKQARSRSYGVQSRSTRR